jgi:hypothetical protein
MGQASPNPDPRTGDESTGFMKFSMDDSVPERTAVLMPNARKITSDYILFTAPNFHNFDPSEESFDIENPACYKQVRFYVDESFTRLYREVRLTDFSGNLKDPVNSIIAETESGSIELKALYKTDKLFEVELSVTEDKDKPSRRTYTGRTDIHILVD